MAKKILIHVCCAGCAAALLDHLKKQNLEPVGYYYNPNIHPRSEYQLRLKTVSDLFKKEKLDLIKANWEPKRYFQVVEKKTNLGERCRLCYRLRLTMTAQKAKNLKISLFGSTLLVSHLQDFNFLAELGQTLAKQHQLEFLSEGFQKFFQAGLKKAQQAGWYLQNYCGCIFSLWEKYQKKYQLK